MIHKESEVTNVPTKKAQDQAVKPAATADDMFAPVEPAATSAERTAAAIDAGTDPFSTSGNASADLDTAFGIEVDAPTPGAIDFEALGEKMRQRKAIEADASAHSGNDNTPVDIETGEQVTTGFFMDLTKDDGFELIAAGTRAVVSCVAAEAVVSSAGNPMLNLRVKIERVKGAPDMSKAPTYRNRSVKDRLMFIPPNETTGSRGTIWRARLAFKAFDIEFDAKAFRTQKEFLDWLTAKAELFIGSVAEVVIGVDDGTSGGTKAAQVDPNTGEAYPPKNTIAQYFKYAPVASVGGLPDTGTGDLPF